MATRTSVQAGDWNSSATWGAAPPGSGDRAMIGHAVSNVVPVVAANRIGNEGGQIFYGHSFICDERGDILAEFGAGDTAALESLRD